MYAEIVSAVQSAKALGELVKAANNLSNYTEFVSAVSEVSAKLMDATAVALASQEKQAALASRVRDLGKELVQIKNFEAEKQRYTLVSIFEGTSSVIALKESMSNGEPPHWLCPNCFHSGKKSFLHPHREQTPTRFGVSCFVCPTKIPGPCSSAASPEYAPG